MQTFSIHEIIMARGLLALNTEYIERVNFGRIRRSSAIGTFNWCAGPLRGEAFVRERQLSRRFVINTIP